MTSGQKSGMGGGAHPQPDFIFGNLTLRPELHLQESPGPPGPKSQQKVSKRGLFGGPPNRERKKHTNINKFAGLSWDWVGAKILFVCFFGSFLMGEKKHINKITPKIPGQSREDFVYVFLCLCVFFRSPQKVPL